MRRIRTVTTIAPEPGDESRNEDDMSKSFASVGFALGLSFAALAAWPQDAGESQGSMQGMPMGDGGTMGGMMADGGMMGGMMADGGMMSGMSCSQMMGGADVTVQNTKDGATIRMRAKSKDQVQHVQHMAQMMKGCMSGEQR
jgi:hypothetical protein